MNDEAIKNFLFEIKDAYAEGDIGYIGHILSKMARQLFSDVDEYERAYYVWRGVDESESYE